MPRLLLGSGGLRTPERLNAWITAFDECLGDAVDTVLFVPYALANHDRYTAEMAERMRLVQRRLVGLHTQPDPVAAVVVAQAVFVGGGNTWRLLREMYRLGLLEPLRQRVAAGMPYVGVSAGSNVACPTILTTNDMPITLPPSPEALGLVPFQINAHYFAGEFHLRDERGELVPYAGETRDDRLREFHEENETPILGLWEGASVRLDWGDGRRSARLVGPAGARWFQRGQPPIDMPANHDITATVFGG